MFEHGTVDAIRLHHADAEPLCATCSEYIETIRTRSMMSVRMRGMSADEVRKALRDERRAEPAGRDNSANFAAWSAARNSAKATPAQPVQTRAAPPRGREQQ